MTAGQQPRLRPVKRTVATLTSPLWHCHTVQVPRPHQPSASCQRLSPTCNTSKQPLYPVEHSPSSEANSCPACQEITCLSWNHEVHYCVHKGLPVIPNMGNSHSVHILTGHYPSIYANITQIFSLFRFLDNDFICI